MYQFGSGYNERRQIMSQNTTSRLYDTFNGIRINIVQVLRSKCHRSPPGCFTSLTCCADRTNFGSGFCNCSCSTDDWYRAARRCGIGEGSAYIFWDFFDFPRFLRQVVTNVSDCQRVG
jgi:hypothetical protein